MTRYALLMLCLLAASASADTYKWTDEDGKVHYTDQPPPAAARKSETIKAVKVPHAATPPAPPADAGGKAPAATAPKSVTDQEMEFRKRKLQQAENEAKAQKDA